MCRRDRVVLALVCSAQFVDVLGVTVLVVALPAIQRDLHLSGEALSWVAASYALAFGGFLVPGGRLADLAGRRTTFVLGSLGVALGSLLCAVARTGGVMFAGRVVQGLGAAVSVPAALAVLLSTFPPGPRRGRALGIWTVAGAVGGASGFVVGGYATQLAGWRWLFAVVVPLGLTAALAALALLEPDHRAANGRLDVAGALLSTTSVVLVILGFNRAEDHGFADPGSWLPLALAPFVAVAFVAMERRTRDPLVPPRLWTVRSFVVGTAVAMVLTATTSGASVVGSLFLQRALGVSAGTSGTFFLLLSLSVVVGSTLAPTMNARIGPILTMTVGLAIITTAMVLLAAAVSQRGLAVFVAGLCLSGLGLGTASVASTAYGTSDATESDAGIVGGILNAAAQIGTAVGIAVLLVTAARSTGAAYLLAAGLAAAALLGTGYHRHRAVSGRYENV